MLLASSVSGLFKWRQFEPEVILLAVGWYLRFSLSYRDVEELLAERGLQADRLSVRAQKLLIMLLAQLDQRVDDFTDIKLFLRDFAKLTSGYPGDVRYTEFVDAAKQFMGRFVSITHPHVLGEKEARGLICHWISSIEKNPNEKSIIFSFDRKLRPYLLGLSKNYFVCKRQTNRTLRGDLVKYLPGLQVDDGSSMRAMVLHFILDPRFTFFLSVS